MLSTCIITLRPLLKYFLICFISTTFLFAQQNKSIPSIEKIYIHTDRTTYTLGESLWYKAYSVYAYNHLLFNESNILYVELISPDSKIILQNKTKLENGLGHGDFKLTDSLGVQSGTYQLRAYTNHSRNFETDFIFTKDIEIIDVFEKTEVSKPQDYKKPVIKNTIKDSKQIFKIQFFPEGGSLINDVESIIAFKAEYENGNPIDVKGKVFDAEGNLVTLFITNHDGMGKFQIKPQIGKKYHAQVSSSNDDLIEQSLPNVLEIGYVLGYKKIKENDFIIIKTNNETLASHANSNFTLIGTTRGISYFEGIQPITKTTSWFQLTKNDFQEGISQFTLYDVNSLPQSERLIFMEKENDLDILLSTDKKIYEPKEKVTVNVSSKTKTDQAVPASFSLSSTDTNGLKDEKDFATNISSYFLMESDIRGNVYNPSYYFDESNPKRLEHLDLLLLTQGWRDFIWKTMPKESDSIQYNVEKNFSVTGHIKQLLGNKPKENSNVTMALMNKNGFNVANAVTDSNGIYKFEDLSFYGTTTMFLNSKNEKGKNSGEIVVYSNEKQPLEVNFKKENVIFTNTTATLKENIYKKYVMYGIAPENVLDEVEIIAKKKDKTPSLYGMADNSFIPDDETQQFSDIYQLIQYSLPGVTVNGRDIMFNRFREPAHIIINGIPAIDSSELGFIQPDDVAKVEAFKGASTAIFGGDGSNGVIAIYTKIGVTSNRTKKVFHSITEKIEGFYEARVFYSPNLEAPSLEADSKLAVRNTLYWNPYIYPDEKTGKSELTYHNSDVETTVKVSLEGITAGGIPIVVHTSYTVEN